MPCTPGPENHKKVRTEPVHHRHDWQVKASARVYDAATVYELLHRTPGRPVKFLRLFFNSKPAAELLMKSLCVVTSNIQAALLGTFRSERTDDHMPAGLDRSEHGLHVRLSLSFICQEMKNRTIMPDIKPMRPKDGSGDISSNPTDALPHRPQPSFCYFLGCLRNVQHRQILETFVQKIVHEGGFAAADIEDRC